MDELRICRSCRFVKPLAHFYASNQSKCKECVKLAARKHRAENIDYYRIYDQRRANLPHRVSTRTQYARTPEGREAHARAAHRWMERHPHRKSAQTAVGNAVRDGRLQREPCFICGERAHAHHPDYERPLDVVWLCPLHHKQAHAIAEECSTCS